MDLKPPGFSYGWAKVSDIFFALFQRKFCTCDNFIFAFSFVGGAQDSESDLRIFGL